MICGVIISSIFLNYTRDTGRNIFFLCLKVTLLLYCDEIIFIYWWGCYHVHIRVVLRRAVPLILISLPRVPTQDGDRREVEGVDREKAKAHIFSIIALVVWHFGLAFNF